MNGPPSPGSSSGMRGSAEGGVGVPCGGGVDMTRGESCFLQLRQLPGVSVVSSAGAWEICMPLGPTGARMAATQILMGLAGPRVPGGCPQDMIFRGADIAGIELMDGATVTPAIGGRKGS